MPRPASAWALAGARPPALPGIHAVLARHEKLTGDVLVVAEAASAGDPDQTLAVLASRAAIEQAKGAVMAVRGCDADEAWRPCAGPVRGSP
jgi:hypothetical protein